MTNVSLCVGTANGAVYSQAKQAHCCPSSPQRRHGGLTDTWTDRQAEMEKQFRVSGTIQNGKIQKNKELNKNKNLLWRRQLGQPSVPAPTTVRRCCVQLFCGRWRPSIWSGGRRRRLTALEWHLDKPISG